MLQTAVPLLMDYVSKVLRIAICSPKELDFFRQ